MIDMLHPDMTPADKNCDQFEFRTSREVESHVEILTKPQTPQDTNLINLFPQSYQRWLSIHLNNY